ncbi:hypothetical protein SLS60_003549 [Paraconiothyrium brasiliense]|uniref:Extracellular membrane protein CFEM domain-containing protein n=1 Tax=Paraconiothyrium brasiliense TaxID=300254 RepID=A0ABR3RPL6_9PLEO
MRHFDGPELPFYSKMYGFFAAKESYLPTENPYAEATGKQNPFPSGYRDRPQGKRMTVTAKATAPTDHMVTQTFTPTEATDACSLWSSLRSYCGNAGQDCACKSGSYWVPDQWNSLAKGCARATTKCSGMDVDDDVWCRLGQTAGDYSTYCADEPTMGAAVTAKFAELADVGADATPTADSDPEPTSDDPEPTSDDPETSSEEADATPTIFSSNTPIFAQTTSEPTTSFYVSSTPTTTFAPAGSSSSHSLNPVIASTFAWISLLTAMIII